MSSESRNNESQASPRSLLLRIAIVGAVTVIALIVLLWGIASRAEYEFSGTHLDPPQQLPDVVGTNWDGVPFRLSDLSGKVVLIFFGYTTCPDVCPTSLAEMRLLKADLGKQADSVEMVFITVDPERDTLERLSQYIPAFDPAFYGVVVEPDPLEAIKYAYGIYAEKVESDTAAGYLVDHTASTSVMDKSNRRRVLFSFGTPVDEMLADVRYLLKE